MSLKSRFLTATILLCSRHTYLTSHGMSADGCSIGTSISHPHSLLKAAILLISSLSSTIPGLYLHCSHLHGFMQFSLLVFLTQIPAVENTWQIPTHLQDQIAEASHAEQRFPVLPGFPRAVHCALCKQISCTSSGLLLKSFY